MNLSITDVETTSVTLEWDPATDADDQTIVRQRDWDGEWGPEETIADLEDDADSYVDGDVHPGATYRYRIEADVGEGLLETSDWLEVETDGLGIGTRSVPPRGWYVEIDHPSGATLRPQILDDPQRNPQVDGFPEVQFSVPLDDVWQSPSLDDADMGLWHNGDEQPIERLEHRREHPDRVELEGRGGTQLERRVIESVDVEPTHEFAEYLIEEYTDYEADVDEPLVDEDPATLLDAAGIDLELAVTQSLLDAIETDEVPLEITDDGIRPLKTAHVVDLQDNVSDDVYSGGQAQDRPSIAADAEFDYVLDADDIGIGIREGLIDEEGIEPTYDVNGEIILESAEAPTHDEPNWFTLENLGSDIDDTDEVQLTITEASGYIVDVVIIYDQRFHDSDEFDNEVHEPGGGLDLQEFPEDPVDVELAELTTPVAINDVDVEATTDDADGLAEIGIGKNGTDDYDVVEDTTTHSLEYDEISTSARVRFGLTARGDLEPQDETPRVGYEPQTLESVTVDALLDSTPVVTDRSFDDRLINVLRELADIGNFVFGVVPSEDGDGLAVQWTQLDQREATVDVDLVDYSVDRQTEDVVERAIIYGGARTATRRSVEVSVGEFVDMPFEDVKLVEGQTDIYDGDTEYEEGVDYELLHTTEDGVPQIRALEDGSLSGGQEVSIDTRVKPRGEFSRASDDADARTIVEDIPGLTTQQMCDQVALYLVDRTAEPLHEVELTIGDTADWDIVSAIDTEALPGEGPYQTREVETTPEGSRLRLADRLPRDEILETIRDRVSQAAERV